MFCTQCAARLDDDARFCFACGAAVESDPRPAAHPQQPSPLRAATSLTLSLFSAPAAGPQPAPAPAPQPSAERQQESATQPAGAARALSFVSLGLLAMALFLPWMEISCGGARVELQGHHMVLGTAGEKLLPLTGELEQMAASMGGRPATAPPMRAQPSLLLLLWLLAAIIGALGAGLSESPGAGAGLGSIGSIFGGIALAAFYLTTQAQISRELIGAMGMIQVRWMLGFWVGVVATLLVGAAGYLRQSEPG